MSFWCFITSCHDVEYALIAIGCPLLNASFSELRVQVKREKGHSRRSLTTSSRLRHPNKDTSGITNKSSLKTVRAYSQCMWGRC